MGAQLELFDIVNGAKSADADIVIGAVPITMVKILWPQLSRHLKRPIDRSHGEATLDGTKRDLLSGNALAVTVSRGSDIIAVNVLEVREFVTGLRALYISLVGGNELQLWLARFLAVAKAIATDLKCAELRGVAVRKGWLRTLKQDGWDELSTVIRCKLGE